MNSSFAQTTEECEKIYTIVEEQPEYKKGTPDLMKHISTEVLSELKCIGVEWMQITSLQIKFVIDKRGNVRDVSFSNEVALTAWCKSKMEKKMLAMKGRTPGKQDGKPVCVAYMLPVRCIMWN